MIPSVLFICLLVLLDESDGCHYYHITSIISPIIDPTLTRLSISTNSPLFLSDISGQ